MISLYSWLIPPAVGAVIGYVTNDIAVKMLFRPLSEKRLLGIRIPFTPGILPRQRKKLAGNIGRMVSRELLTDAIVRGRLRSPEFRSVLEQSIAEYTDKLLGRSVASLAGGARPDESELVRAVQSMLLKFIDSEAFAVFIRSTSAHAVSFIGEHSLADLLRIDGSDGSKALDDAIERLSAEFFSPDNEARFVESAEKVVGALMADGRPLEETLPDTAAMTVVRMAEALYPVLIDSALKFLHEPSTRTELEVRGKLFLRDAIAEMSAVQRFFVSAAQYDRTLNERMPAIIDDLTNQFEDFAEDPRTLIRFTESVSGAFRDLASLPIRQAADRLRLDPVEISGKIASRLFQNLKPRPYSGDDDPIRSFLRRSAEEPLSKVMARHLGFDIEHATRFVSDALIARVRRDAPDAMPRFVGGVLSEYGDRSLVSILSIDADERSRMNRYLTDRILAIMDERISSILQSLDISKVVSDRIDSLDMLDVERIVLDVLADQLKWINVFGAVLGALLGIVQVSLMRFMG